MFKRLSLSERIFTVANMILLSLLSLLVLYPIWYIFVSAVSNPIAFDQAMAEKTIILLPQGFTLEYLSEHIQNMDIWRAYGNTIYYTVVGTLISMVLTICAAFVLSRRNVKGVKIMTIIVVLTIWMNPGMIATYLNIENLSLMRTRSGIIYPFAFSAFNVILLRTSFMGIPQELEESAQIDGAGHFRMLWSIVLPNNIPAIITVTLFYAIQRWNGYFWAEIVLGDYKLYPLQVLVKKMLQSGGDSAQLFEGTVSAFALIVIAVVPMIIVFPFIQKYFKKGVMLGSGK
jgi:putative aldouronate transport system permease protein